MIKRLQNYNNISRIKRNAQTKSIIESNRLHGTELYRAIEGLGDIGIAILFGGAGDDDVSMEMLLMAQLTGLLPSC